MKNYVIILGVLFIIGVCVVLHINMSNNYQKQNDILTDSIRARNKELQILDSTSRLLNVKKDYVLVEINRITRNTDSLENVISINNGKIKNSATKITNLKKQSYEEINTIDSWSFNNYNSFFTNYFKDKQ
jgi:hypothetical protein